jgi:hypothetical protein
MTEESRGAFAPTCRKLAFPTRASRQAGTLPVSARQRAGGVLIASFELNRFFDTNQTYCEFLGFERDELLGTDPCQFWLDTTFPDDRETEQK